MNGSQTISKTPHHVERTPGPGPGPRQSRKLQWLWIIVLTAATLVLAYVVENIRGEKAWSKVQRDLLSRGHRLDLTAFPTPSIPDDQNFLKAPIVKEWFSSLHLTPGAAQPPDLIRIPRPNDVNLLGSWRDGRPTDLKEWRDYFRRTRISSETPPRHDFQTGSASPSSSDEQSPADAETSDSTVPEDTDQLEPLIVIDGLPLMDALRLLARQTKIELQFAPSALAMTEEGKPRLEIPIAIRFENVTTREALEAVAQAHGLALQETSIPNRWLVERALPPAPIWPNEAVDLTTTPLPASADEIVSIIRIDEVPACDAIRNLARHAGLNFQFDAEARQQIAEIPYSLELTSVTPRAALGWVLADLRLALWDTGTPAFHIIVPSYRVLPMNLDHAASTILASFANCDEQFQAIDAACQRPASRLDIGGSGSHVSGSPAINYLIFRQLAQALTLHASAHLALGNSARALQDATALHRLARSLSGQPSLVPTMTQVALGGLYLQVVWEGLASRRWTPEQLTALQLQLSSFDLWNDCALAFEGEQARMMGWLENTPRAALAEQFVERIAGEIPGNRSLPLWTGPVRWGVRFGPRGWIRQLQIGYAEAFQTYLNQWDAPHHRAIPSPQPNSLSAWVMPDDAWLPLAALTRRFGLNYVKALEVTARHQTAIEHARLACALERYRQGKGGFPTSLASLKPNFIDRIPNNPVTGLPVNYQPLNDGDFVLVSASWEGTENSSAPAEWLWRYPGRP